MIIKISEKIIEVMDKMQRYIEQIIQDLKEAKKNVPPDPMLGTEKNYEEFEEKMFAMETAPDIPMKEMFGVSYEELPPPEKLSDEQMIQIIEAIEDTFAEFNIDIYFREEIPLKLRYEILRDRFADDIFYMPGYSMTIDFCSGWCPECKIIDYCDTVWDSWTKEELKEEQEKIKNGFYDNIKKNNVDDNNSDILE